MSVNAKFDVISYLKSITEPSPSGPVHPTTSAVRSWCYRHGEMLTMTKRGDSGKLVALAPESLRGEIYKQFTSRPRPREPRKRKAACLAPIEDVRLAANDLGNKIAAAERKRTETINAAVELADEEYRRTIEEATEKCKKIALAISPPQQTI